MLTYVCTCRVNCGVPLRGIFGVNEALRNAPAPGNEWPHDWVIGPELNLFSWAFDNTTGWFGQTFHWLRQAADKAVASAPAGTPRVRLFYNDYSIETQNAKSNATLKWLIEQKAAGVPIDGIGFQSHLYCNCGGYPATPGCNDTNVVAANMKRFIDAGFDVWV